MSQNLNEEEVKNNILSIGQQNETFAKYFKGVSYRHPLVEKDKTVNVSVSSITFTPGCRNNWHRHLGYQILIVTGGEGWYQEENQKPRLLKKVDVVISENHKKHWHGATKDSWFSHIAITSGKAEWYNPVSDDEYNKLAN